MSDIKSQIHRLCAEYSCGPGCIFGSPPGQGTNGACKHARGDAYAVKSMWRFVREVRKAVDDG